MHKCVHTWIMYSNSYCIDQTISILWMLTSWYYYTTYKTVYNFYTRMCLRLKIPPQMLIAPSTTSPHAPGPLLPPSQPVSSTPQRCCDTCARNLTVLIILYTTKVAAPINTTMLTVHTPTFYTLITLLHTHTPSHTHTPYIPIHLHIHTYIHT